MTNETFRKLTNVTGTLMFMKQQVLQMNLRKCDKDYYLKVLESAYADAIAIKDMLKDMPEV